MTPGAARGEPRPKPPAKAPREAPEAAQAVSPPPESAQTPRSFLIYLRDGGEPIVVPHYVEEHGEIRFEKYGGSIGIPTYEVQRIVPDEADRSPSLALPLLAPREDGPRVEKGDLYLSLQSGGNLKVQSVEPEGERVRVSVPEGSFSVPRSEIVGVVRVPTGPDAPEAWLSVVQTGPGTPPAPEAPTAPEAAPERDGRAGAPAGPAPAPSPSPDAVASALAGPRIPYERSDRPHFVRLANGQLMRLDGFSVEDGQLRFQRFGGMIGIALTEVLRLIPEEIAPVPGRTQVRFAQQLGPDLLEVNVRSGVQRVRLLGITPVDGVRTDESPWRHLEQGALVYLEFDRQRYDPEGNWLAYVFLPNHRMLNAELIRVGLARPHADGRNVRYLDLFHELATGDLPDGAGTTSIRSN